MITKKRKRVSLWVTIAVLLAVALVTMPLWGGAVGKQGATPYTPTQGEWLWLAMNTERALFTAEQEPSSVAVRYLYDRSKPNTIQIELLITADVAATAVRSAATIAEKRTMEMARLYGWDQWIRIEFQERKLTGPPEMESLLR
jgi:hypothetical protein